MSNQFKFHESTQKVLMGTICIATYGYMSMNNSNEKRKQTVQNLKKQNLPGR